MVCPPFGQKGSDSFSLVSLASSLFRPHRLIQPGARPHVPLIGSFFFVWLQADFLQHPMPGRLRRRS